MKKEDIHLFDIKRIVLGEAPLTFLVEICFRTALIFTCLLVVMKLLGKRASAQMTITEMTVIITLGAIIAPVMQMPDKGLLQAIIILFTILILQKLLNIISLKRSSFEHILQGTEELLVKDGEILQEAMDRSRISKNQLFEELRKKGVHHLGQVKRVYVEACGLFSVYKESDTDEGPSVMPDKDFEMRKNYETRRH
jgi:uncharacterized membrane protein YcaP (DUF421 family)